MPFQPPCRTDSRALMARLAASQVLRHTTDFHAGRLCGEPSRWPRGAVDAVVPWLDGEPRCRS